MFSRKHTRAAALGVVGIFALAGCGLGPSTSTVPAVGQGSLEPVEGAEGQELVVTSKNFTEQIILGKIAVLTAEAAGFEPQDMTNVPGSQPVRNLMTSGDADVTVEYTGTAWLTYMGHEQGIPDQQEQWQAVHDEDLGNGLTWGAPGTLNNTYALAVRQEYAEANGITELSDLARVPVEDRTICVESEFNSRSDGLNPMLSAYGLERGAADGVPDSNIAILDTGTVYTATAGGDTCNFGEVFTTDGRIDSLNLTVLEDDRNFFPAYNASPVFNTEFLDRYPELEDRYDEVVSRLTDEKMRDMNLKVDVEGQDPAQVAFDWMVGEGLISES
ncbi:glycine betaine ABC transporter substrate-binding protein [Rothia sp. AR01]|uniref:Glycine betaine ABC transporter substrate-binding protein n=1 Tax=Rothia santali TaxID=2949643 RepID=A0A9X2HB95_9MICC|nr:glycine betaine ABC transporter substrate-binding protein [Rothia santali]MCP3424955.1 glycine betaine ABC transporter substrate-binding protein [Rothia santali]